MLEVALSFQLVKIWGVVSSGGVDPLSVISVSVFYQEVSNTLMLPSSDKLYTDAGFIRPAALCKCPLPKVSIVGSMTVIF